MIPKPDWEFDLKDETERKCLETLADLRASFIRGAITPHAYATALAALNSAWRGLIDPNINLAIDAALQELGKQPAREFALFSVGEAKLLAVTRMDDVLECFDPQTGQVYNLNRLAPELPDLRALPDPMVAATKGFDAICAALKRRTLCRRIL